MNVMTYNLYTVYINKECVYTTCDQIYAIAFAFHFMNVYKSQSVSIKISKGVTQ